MSIRSLALAAIVAVAPALLPALLPAQVPDSLRSDAFRGRLAAQRKRAPSGTHRIPYDRHSTHAGRKAARTMRAARTASSARRVSPRG